MRDSLACFPEGADDCGNRSMAVKRLPYAEGLPLPGYQSPGAVSRDLLAALPPDTKILLELVQTGIVLALPQINHGYVAFEVVRGARTAQLVVTPPIRVVLCEASEVDMTVRAAYGFGSTGQLAGEGKPK